MLSAGSVSVVNADGSVIGSGLAKALVEADIAANYVPAAASAGVYRQNMPGFYNRLAEVLIDYLLANASITVTVHTTDSGLQRDPSSSDPTLAPSANKTLTGTLT